MTPARRRELRKAATDAERVLWRALRGGRLGAKFRRRHSIEAFVVDFYRPAARLAIEVDGGQHYDDAERVRDRDRTRQLALRHITMLRFTNVEVLTETQTVVEHIARSVRTLTPMLAGG